MYSVSYSMTVMCVELVNKPALFCLQVFYSQSGSKQENHAVQASALLREDSRTAHSAGGRWYDRLRSTHLADEAEKPIHDRADLQEGSSDAFYANQVLGQRYAALYSAGVQGRGGVESEFSQGRKCGKHP